MLIQMNQVNKTLAGYPLLKNAQLNLHVQTKMGLIGRNGSGKTTLFQLLTGHLLPDSGTVSRTKNLRIGEIKQQPPYTEEKPVAYMMHDYPEWQHWRQRLDSLEKQMQAGESSERILLQYGDALEHFQDNGGYELEDQCLSLLRGLGIEQLRETPLHLVSGGERARVELAKTLVQQTDVLLLDEPTNHLDHESLEWLSQYLQHTAKPYIVISHDRYFLDQVVTEIIELEDGELRHFRGNYQQYAEQKRALIVKMQKDFDLQQRERSRLERSIRQYRQWGNESDNEKFFKKAKELERRLAKMTVIAAPVATQKRLRTDIQEIERSGKEVCKWQNVAKKVGGKTLFSAVDLVLYRGERVALLGENGSGKSTFLELFGGALVPDSGSVVVGSSVKIGKLPQTLHFEEPEMRLVQYVMNEIGNEQKARTELARFGFYAGDVAKRIGDLSGGEKVRVALLKLFLAEVNVLLLDEPTNHLDIEAREEIEELLDRYQGTLLVVSHDRYFIDKTTDTQFILAEGTIRRVTN